MKELLRIMRDGSCGSLKKNVRAGVDIFTPLFVVICCFFWLIQGVVSVARFMGTVISGQRNPK